MDRVWWNHITRANKFLEDVVATAVEGKSMILSLPEAVPWHNTLMELVGERLQLENPKNLFEKIECPGEEIGLFLLNKYCKKEKRASYRYGMTYASFLGKSGDIVLNDRYIWVTDIPQSKYDEWICFILEYNKNVTMKTPAIFILETSDPSFIHKAGKGIGKISFEQNIDAYDKFAFCALAAADNNCKNHLRPYLAELVSTICKEDIELCAECILQGTRFLDNPLHVIKTITTSGNRSNGEQYQFVKTQEQVKQLIWETQIKCIFPRVEKYRYYFINQYRNKIMSVLPINNSYGEVVMNPQDVEIGTLLYMVRNGAIAIGDCEYDNLVMYRDARNKLAHMEVLDFVTLEHILRN